MLDHLEIKSPKKWIVIVKKDHVPVHIGKNRNVSAFVGYSVYLGIYKNETKNRIILKLSSREIRRFNKSSIDKTMYLKRKPTTRVLTYLQQYLKIELDSDKVYFTL